MYLEQFCKVYGVKYIVFRGCIPYGTLIPGASSYGTAEFMLAKAAKESREIDLLFSKLFGRLADETIKKYGIDEKQYMNALAQIAVNNYANVNNKIF